MGCFVRFVRSRKDCIDLMHDDIWKGGTRFYLNMAEGPGGGGFCVGGGGGVMRWGYALGERGRVGCDAQVNASCRVSG